MIVMIVASALTVLIVIVVMMLVMLMASALTVLIVIVVMMLVMLMASALTVLIVIVVMMLVMLMASALAMLIVIVVMMLVMLMTTALAVLVVIVVVMLVMLMASALAVLVVIVVMVLVMLMTTALAVLIVIVVMMLVMLMASALAVIAVMVMMVLMLFLKRLYSILKGILVLHSCENITTGKRIPGSCNDDRAFVMLTKESNALGDFLILCRLCMRKHNGRCISNLVVIELAKVLHIHLALINIGNGGKAIESSAVILGSLCRTNNVRELAYSRGLDDDSVGIILLKHLNKRLREITNQRTADAARIHLGDLNSRIGKEAAVNTDLAKLVLNQHNLLTGISLFNKLFYKCSFSRTKKSGKNINFSHFVSPLKNTFTDIIIIYIF